MDGNQLLTHQLRLSGDDHHKADESILGKFSPASDGTDTDRNFMGRNIFYIIGVIVVIIVVLKVLGLF